MPVDWMQKQAGRGAAMPAAGPRWALPATDAVLIEAGGAYRPTSCNGRNGSGWLRRQQPHRAQWRSWQRRPSAAPLKPGSYRL